MNSFESNSDISLIYLIKFYKGNTKVSFCKKKDREIEN